MLRHNLILIYRNFKRFKSTFFINLIGLSSGLACALLIYLWVNDELSMDKFHEKDSQLFEVMMNVEEPNEIKTLEYTPGLLANTLKEEMPEVENAVAIIPYWDPVGEGIVSFGNIRVKANERYADKEYFNIFSYKLIHGDKDQVLSDKNAILVSDETAVKLFGTTDVIGKSITWDKGEFHGLHTISGVFKKPPRNSTAQFDILLHYDFFMEKYPQWLKWANASSITYLVLKSGTDVNQFNSKIVDFIKSKPEGSTNTLFVRPYSDQYLYDHYENGVQAGGRIAYVKLFSIIALFILAIACINFMNLSTAKASRRVKEIGVKKAMGAARKTLIFQYMGESMFMTVLSLIVSVLMVDLFLPQFNIITAKQLALQFDTNLILAVCSITLFTGIISGSYPALYLSGFNPVTVLKGKLNTSLGELWSRKALVMFQFAISVILIVSVAVVYRQMELIQTKNLGYNKDNIVYFNSEGVGKTFLSRIKKIPGVVNASTFSHDMTGDHGTAWGFSWEDQNPGGGEIVFVNLTVGYDFTETFGIEIIEGRSFSRELGSDKQIIMNEAAIERMGLNDPIGKIFTIWGHDRQIVGVVRNFHFESLHEKVKPCFLLLAPKGSVNSTPGEIDKVMVKVQAGTEKLTLERLQKFFQE